MNIDKAVWREETTDWDTPNHIYLTIGTDLVGYVPCHTGILQVFSKPMKSWSVTRRKFRKLSKKEIATYTKKL
jgi:hypothetical protein